MMCWDTFEEQPEAYKEEVLMLKERKEGKVLCAYVEAAATLGASCSCHSARAK